MSTTTNPGSAEQVALPADPAREHYPVHHVAAEVPLAEVRHLPDASRVSVTAFLDTVNAWRNAAGAKRANVMLVDELTSLVVEVAPGTWQQYGHHLTPGWSVFAELRVWQKPGEPTRVMLMSACVQDPDVFPDTDLAAPSAFQQVSHAIEADHRGGVQP